MPVFSPSDHEESVVRTFDNSASQPSRVETIMREGNKGVQDMASLRRELLGINPPAEEDIIVRLKALEPKP